MSYLRQLVLLDQSSPIKENRKRCKSVQLKNKPNAAQSSNNITKAEAPQPPITPIKNPRDSHNSNIIPRSIKVVSKKKGITVGEMRGAMRKNRYRHMDFNPLYESPTAKIYLDGVYAPNTQATEYAEQQHVHDLIIERGNYKRGDKEWGIGMKMLRGGNSATKPLSYYRKKRGLIAKGEVGGSKSIVKGIEKDGKVRRIVENIAGGMTTYLFDEEYNQKKDVVDSTVNFNLRKYYPTGAASSKTIMKNYIRGLLDANKKVEYQLHQFKAQPMEVSDAKKQIAEMERTAKEQMYPYATVYDEKFTHPKPKIISPNGRRMTSNSFFVATKSNPSHSPQENPYPNLIEVQENVKNKCLLLDKNSRGSSSRNEYLYRPNKLETKIANGMWITGEGLGLQRERTLSLFNEDNKPQISSPKQRRATTSHGLHRKQRCESDDKLLLGSNLGSNYRSPNSLEHPYIFTKSNFQVSNSRPKTSGEKGRARNAKLNKERSNTQMEYSQDVILNIATNTNIPSQNTTFYKDKLYGTTSNVTLQNASTHNIRGEENIAKDLSTYFQRHSQQPVNKDKDKDIQNANRKTSQDNLVAVGIRKNRGWSLMEKSSTDAISPNNITKDIPEVFNAQSSIFQNELLGEKNMPIRRVKMRNDLPHQPSKSFSDINQHHHKFRLLKSKKNKDLNRSYITPGQGKKKSSKVTKEHLVRLIKACEIEEGKKVDLTSLNAGINELNEDSKDMGWAIDFCIEFFKNQKYKKQFKKIDFGNVLKDKQETDFKLYLDLSNKAEIEKFKEANLENSLFLSQQGKKKVWKPEKLHASKQILKSLEQLNIKQNLISRALGVSQAIKS